MNWESDRSEILFNPRMSLEEQQRIQHLLLPFARDGHLWLATSGSTGIPKWTALSKTAILNSARAVNIHLNSSQIDCWVNPLPHFHVGGLGILARSHLSHAKLVNAQMNKWNPKQFHRVMLDSSATLTALVPTQLYDLVSDSLVAPPSLRATIIGGGALSPQLYSKALQLGWNPLPSYGLTENASQVATASLESLQGNTFPNLNILSHVEVRVNDSGYICLSSNSLLTGYVLDAPDGPQFIDPKIDGWLHTEDRGHIEGGHLTVYGRESNFIKIGGESVDLLRLDHLFQSCKLECKSPYDFAIIAMPHERLGHVIHLVTTGPLELVQPVIDLFHKKILPFERILQVHCVDEIPRTELQKLDRQRLLEIL